MTILVAMVIQRYQNSCIFAAFLKHFKFPSLKGFENLMPNSEYKVEQYIKKWNDRTISFLDICRFLF